MMVFMLAIMFEWLLGIFVFTKKKGILPDDKKQLTYIVLVRCTRILLLLACFVDICEASCAQEAPGGTEKAVNGYYTTR